MGSLANWDDTPYGRRLLPTLIDHVASSDPNRECIQMPRSSQPSDGWRVVTWKAMANAVNRCAHRIVELCGTPEKGSFPTIAYIGPNDARYIVTMVAAVKAGYKALFISPRNSSEGQLNLFEQTDCNIIAFASSHKDTVQPWLQEREMQAIEVSPLDAWFPDEEVPHFPYLKSFEEGQWEPLAVLHTSGSTGFPKPILVKLGMLAISDAWHSLPEWNDSKISLHEWADNATRSFVSMPLFHIAGLFCTINFAMHFDRPVCLPISDRPMSADLVVESLENMDVDSLMIAPALIEDMSQTKEGSEALGRLNIVGFGGGNLPREAGNRLVKQGVRLMNLIGATEFAPFPNYIRKDGAWWQYLVYNPDVMGSEFRKQDGYDDVYELVIVRQKQNMDNPGMQGIFYTFPELTEWSTRDLYRPHPTLPHHWIYHGRADNIIVLSNAEKLNPVTIEEIVADHPNLKGAMVVGSQRPQAGLLVEPHVQPKTEEEERALLDSVWTLVERANQETVAHGRISRDMVALSNPDKPFLRSGKGTIQRALTVQLYEEDISRMYERAGGDTDQAAPKLDLESEETLAQSIVEALRAHVAADKLDDVDVDFFAAGIDSLGVMRASKFLRAGLKAAGYDVELATRAIYSNSTPRRLAAHIMNSVYHNQNGALGEDEQQQQAMRAIHEKYTQHLIKAQPGRPDPVNEGQTVILTGSTGMLGSYLLNMMLHDSRVAKIICLNRAADGGRAQQAKASADRGLDASLLDTKAEFHHADLSRPDLGLPAGVYRRLQSDADRAILNAWPVNFNIPIESFEQSLAGVRHIADLAATASKRVAVTFISSIAVADRWDPDRHGGDKVPERRLEDWALPAGGYGRSKMVGSLIIEDASAAHAGDFPCAVVRVGQVAGPEAEAGMWSRQEWLPSIIASSLYLGALPRDLGAMNRVDWTPAERVARLVLEASGVSGARDVERADDVSGYYHGVNPHESNWEEDLAAAVQDFYGKERIRELVGFGEWVDLLERSQADGEETVARNPGVKLIDSYRGMAAAGGAGRPVVYDMEATARRCPSVRETTAVTPGMMKHWCEQWGY